MFLWNSLDFIWSNGYWQFALVPLPFLNPACPSGSSWFTYYWSLAWMILSITHWNECNCPVVWTLFGIAILWDWNENWHFPVLCHCWVFQISCHIGCKTYTVSSFRIWHSSTGIQSPPLALFVVMLLRPTCLHTPGCLALGEWSHHHGYLCHEAL